MCRLQDDSEPQTCIHCQPMMKFSLCFNKVSLFLLLIYPEHIIISKWRNLPFLTINTHKGLFHYQHLPFMSMVLQGCKGVVCYVDNILVTGQTLLEHEENLQEAFRHLQQYGLKIILKKC